MKNHCTNWLSHTTTVESVRTEGKINIQSNHGLNKNQRSKIILNKEQHHFNPLPTLVVTLHLNVTDIVMIMKICKAPYDNSAISNHT